MGPCVSMEIGHIHSEGDAVKRLGHRREKPEQLRPRPDGKVIKLKDPQIVKQFDALDKTKPDPAKGE